MQATVKEVKPDGVTVVYGSGRSGFLAADLTPVPEGFDQVIMPQAAIAS